MDGKRQPTSSLSNGRVVGHAEEKVSSTGLGVFGKTPDGPRLLMTSVSAGSQAPDSRYLLIGRVGEF